MTETTLNEQEILINHQSSIIRSKEHPTEKFDPMIQNLK
jgi:hypothetical protein